MSNADRVSQEARGYYEPPCLKQWGGVSDITQQGGSTSGNDMFDGSVVTAASDNNPVFGDG